MSSKKAVLPTVTHAAPVFVPALELSMIVESPHNPRKRYDPQALQELADNIAEVGVIEAVLVRPTADVTRFELAAGHRRSRAARMAGHTHVPAMIREMDERTFLEILHLSNLQREGVDPLDEALGYEQLLAQGYDVSSLANKLGRSVTYVASRIRLLTLGSAARMAMQLGFLPLSHAIELARLPEARQEEILSSTFWLDSAKLAAAALEPEAAAPAPEVAAEPASEVADEEDDDDLYPGEEDDDDLGEEVESHRARTQVDARLRIARTVNPFSRNTWDEPRVPTLEMLRRTIKEGMRRLSVVQWPLGDADLVPSAGSCTACPKRSGASGELFAEYDVGEDVCLDAACFGAKSAAYERARQAAVSTKDSEATDAGAYQSERPRLAQLSDASAEEQKRRERMKRQQEREKRAGLAVLKAVCEKVGEFEMLSTEFLRLFFATMLQTIDDNDHLEELMYFLGVDTTEPDGKLVPYDWREARLRAWAQDADTVDTQIPPAILFVQLRRCVGTVADMTYCAPFAELLQVPMKAIAAAAAKEKPAVKEKATPAKRVKRRSAA